MGTIYSIQNKTNEATYIGSVAGNRLIYRWRRHKKDLRAGKHHSRFLQRAWDKYGSHVFEFERLEEVDDSVLLATEQKYLDDRKANLPRNMTYNVLWTAGNCTGRKATVETKRRLSESHMGIRRSKSSIKRQRKTWKGKWDKPYSLIDCNGKVYRNVRGIRGFAREHGLESNCLRLLLAGTIRHHKGWTILGTIIKKFSLVSPDGVRYDDIVLLKKFCIERGLPYKQVHKLFRGDRKRVQGWTKG